MSEEQQPAEMGIEAERGGLWADAGLERGLEGRSRHGDNVGMDGMCGRQLGWDTATSPLVVNPGPSTSIPWTWWNSFRAQAADSTVGGSKVSALALGVRGRRVLSLACLVWSAGPPNPSGASPCAL